ncbi:hypothetical protein ACTVZO_37065 [Streptomyces sp. IBSNAI002]|uniref:hypothetical protein n=1 Tax=Streptomyces sp. IBSNAI002 TaxID=3457500 RepID=UPI003FCFA5ED
MPMRLDIVVDATGKVVSFAARDVANPPLPGVQVDAAGARSALAAGAPHSPIVPGEPVLVAADVRGAWRPVWRFPLSLPGKTDGPVSVALVDAANGEVIQP